MNKHAWKPYVFWVLLTEGVGAVAANLQWPYLLWTAFAAYLNLGVWLLNR